MLKVVLGSIFTLMLLHSFGQGNSPYSELGMGSVNKSTFQSNFGMGGLNATYDSKYFINPENPASYSKIKYTVGEAGVYYSNNYYSDSTGNGTNNTFNLGHLDSHFP